MNEYYTDIKRLPTLWIDYGNYTETHSYCEDCLKKRKPLHQNIK